MIKYNLYLGLNDKDSKRQKISELTAINIISKYIPNCSITPFKGIYTHENGQQVKENSLLITVIDFDNNFKPIPVTRQLKQLFNQESIIVETEESNSIAM